nr:retrotransposon Orf1 [Tanacetum cinerariifolium]
MLYHYKLGLSQVEASLVEFKNQEIKFCEKIRGIEFKVESKDNRIERLTKDLEELKKEKEGLDSKLTGFHNSSVSENGESSSSILSKPVITFVKATDSPRVIKTNKTKTARKPPVKYVEMYKNTSKRPKVRGNKRNWNNLMNQRLGSNFMMKNKACFKCGHFDHLAYEYGVWVEKGKSWPKKNFAHKNVTPRVDLFKTTSVSAARRVNTAAPRPNVNCARPKTTQDLVIILIQRVKRLERELKARTPPIKIHYVDVKGRS